MNFGDLKRIVTTGYDRIAPAYETWAARIHSPERDRLTGVLRQHLTAGAKVLELGCGNGQPTSRILSQSFKLTAVDISHVQIERARNAAPHATFIEADMAELSFPTSSFDAVIALFSIIHLPCEEHGTMFKRIFEWITPGGIFAFNSGANASYRGYEEDWLGAPMFWSHFSPEETRQLLIDAGFLIQSQRIETINEGHGAATFVWWSARKPEEAAGS